MNIDHNYYDTTYFIKKKKKLYVIACNEQLFSYIKAMKQKEIKAPIIYESTHTCTNKHTKKQKIETKRSNIANLNIHWLS